MDNNANTSCLLQMICLLILTSVCRCNANHVYCYSNDSIRPQNQHYSVQAPHPNITIVKYDIKGCNPVKIWLVSRHGTRYPSKRKNSNLKYLEKIRDHIRKSDNVCQEDYDLIKNWHLDKSYKPENLAANQGWNDLMYLSKTFQEMFPTLFDRIYSEKNYTFIHSEIERTKDSCKAFILGLFGSRNSANISMKIESFMLRPYSQCPIFEQNLKKVKKHKGELLKFRKHDIFKTVIEQVNKRLGLKKKHCLNEDDIFNMWYECSYQQAEKLHEPSSWCAAFDVAHVHIIEYFFDLYYYYKCSYGLGPLARNLACVTVKDMIQDMVTTNSKSKKVTAYFAQSTLIMLMLAAFGTHHDRIPLLADNYFAQNNREFRTSKICPFAANIAAIKYECSNNDEDKVLFLLNQKPLKMDWCHAGEICTISELKKMFENSSMHNCPFDVCGQEFSNIYTKNTNITDTSDKVGTTVIDLSLSDSTNSDISDEPGTTITNPALRVKNVLH